MKIDIDKAEFEIKLDPSTGLPELPEGLRWRVTDELSEQYVYGSVLYPRATKLRVLLEESYPGFHTDEQPNPDYRWWNFEPYTVRTRVDEIKWRHLDAQETTEISSASVLAAAKILFGRLQQDADRQALIGTYPPKKLGVAS